MFKNDHIEEQVSALRKYGVPVDAVETYSDERAEIRLVKCLLSYIVNPTPPLLKAEIISLMYGKTLDEPMTFAELLQEIEKIEGLERIRFMTSHPKDLSDELIEVMKNSKKI